MIISQVGPAKDEEAAGEEEETLEQWRMSKMEKEKWMQVAYLLYVDETFKRKYFRSLRRNRAESEVERMWRKRMMRKTVSSSRSLIKLSRG